MKIVFMGTGTSQGVPVIGYDSSGIDLSNPKNWRTRSSIHVYAAGKEIQVDAAPEFRLQCLKNSISRADAFILTHGHADHIAGMDDTQFSTDLDSPYNTYLHVGLTPTPIANPGLASLQAALNPESHNYYYYVLNPATGMHQFSTTQEEHEQYRAQFAAAAAAASTQSEDE